MDKRKKQNKFEFKGFGDFIEVFRSGEHTSSNGVKRTWTNEELDQMVANHSAETAVPVVVGHPKTNDPAFGWSETLKRVGDSLLGKFKDINPEFESSVERGEYRTRSSKIYRKPDGTFALEHVGFLGAQRPAIPLDAMSYSAVDAEECYEFEADWQTPNAMARTMRRMRDFFIERFGLETADQVLPDYEVESMSEHAAAMRDEAFNDDTSEPAFSAGGNDGSTTGDNSVSEFSQQQLDDAVAAAVQAEQDKAKGVQAELDAERRKSRQAEFQAFVDGLTCDPAQTEGAVEFLCQLDETENQAFEFSVGDETKKTTLVDHYKARLAALKPSVDAGEADFSGDVDSSDAPALAAAAVEFQASERKAGRDISVSTAMQHVIKGA